MKIHYFKQFFSSPDAPGALQPRELCLTLAKRGHDVTVVACNINVYNEQVEPPEEVSFPKGGRLLVTRLQGTKGLRRNLMTRLRSYGDFALRAAFLLPSLGRPDVVVASIQPLFTGHVGLLDASLHRCPFILEVRDLWPDALVVKGAISPVQAKPLFWLAGLLYRRANRIVSLTPGIKTELLKKGLPPHKIDVFPNGFHKTLFQISPGTRERVRAELGWQDHFVVVYTGAHTEVTAVDVIVRAASLLKDHPKIRFDLFGQGQTKARCIALAQELGLTNVSFHDPVPKKRIPEVLAGADLAVMALFRSPLIHIYFENKLMDYFGAALPVVAAMEGVQADLIRRFEAGVVVPTYDHEGLAKSVLEAFTDQKRFRQYGLNGRTAVERYLLLEDIVERYADMIEAVADGKDPPAWEPFS